MTKCNLEIDAFGGVLSLKKESVSQIKALMTEFDLIDIWRVRNQTYRKFTWRRSKPVTLRRHDYFLVSSHMELDIASCVFFSEEVYVYIPSQEHCLPSYFRMDTLPSPNIPFLLDHLDPWQ